MKKTLILFLFLTSCTIVIPQIPPQTVSPDDCKVAIPNLIPLVSSYIKWGCSGGVITQNPTAGTIITNPTATISVLITATGNNSKIAKSIVITVADTVKPKFTGMTSDYIKSYGKVVSDLYNIADGMNEDLEMKNDQAYKLYTGTDHSEDLTNTFIRISMRDSVGRFSGYGTYLPFTISY